MVRMSFILKVSMAVWTLRVAEGNNFDDFLLVCLSVTLLNS